MINAENDSSLQNIERFAVSVLALVKENAHEQLQLLTRNTRIACKMYLLITRLIILDSSLFTVLTDIQAMLFRELGWESIQLSHYFKG